MIAISCLIAGYLLCLYQDKILSMAVTAYDALKAKAGL